MGKDNSMGTLNTGTIPGVRLPVTRIVQGSIQLNTEDQSVGFTQLDTMVDVGINTIDSAYIYGGGAQDRLIGSWMAARGNREEIVVIAKGCHPGEGRNRVTPYDIGTQLHDILIRMKTDYVDLFVLHRDDKNVAVEPIVDTLNQYVREGKTNAFGGSNWTPARLAEANAYADSTGQVGFCCSSPNFSLARQLHEPWDDCVTISGPENEADRSWYQEGNMPLFTWSSMAGGFMSGRITRSNTATFTDYFGKLAVHCYASEDNFVRVDRAAILAERKGLSMPQVALAYVLNFPLNIFALVGSANEEEMRSNAAASLVTLTSDERDFLDLKADFVS